MKTVAIIQARMNSSRLPGKVLTDIAGKPLIQRVVDRARAAKVFDEVVVATSQEASDDSLVLYCEENDIPVFRGNLNDVLDRYVQAATKHNADIVVRLTGDCPLLDSNVLHKLMTMYETGDFDYVSNVVERTYPDGLDAEVMSIETLKRAHQEATLPSEREHVTPYIHKHPEQFRLGHLTMDRDLTQHRWTVDEPRDLELVRAIVSHFGDKTFGMEDVLAFLEANPSLQRINAGIPTNEGMKKSLEDDAKWKNDTLL
jgi:spore coat polysaccharide biosynthesis protein SpsF